MAKLAMAVLLAAGGWAAWAAYVRWQVEPIAVRALAAPRVEFDGAGRAAVRHVGVQYETTLARFRDEVFAYLMLQHFRTTRPARSGDYLLVYRGGEPAEYDVVLSISNDEIASVQTWVELEGKAPLEMVPLAEDTRFRNQTRFFDSAYNMPVTRRMEELSQGELRALMRRFIRFKSTTDPRVRGRMEPVPKVLTSGEAEQLAGDMIAVAEFYELPLIYLLGIGAMENNYMDVRGDLEHSIWKRRAAKDDIVLQRRRGRVRVLNDSAGLWQITRETLRYAHKQYLKDTRDYGRLPEHLRPPKKLEMNEVRPEVLTTYAGLLLRDLLDRFDGDVALAVGAYNGGPGKPNAQYEEGVRRVAGYARGVLERTAGLNGESVLERSWFVPR